MTKCREWFEENEVRNFKDRPDFEEWKKHILERNEHGSYQALFTEDHWQLVKLAWNASHDNASNICKEVAKVRGEFDNNSITIVLANLIQNDKVKL